MCIWVFICIKNESYLGGVNKSNNDVVEGYLFWWFDIIILVCFFWCEDIYFVNGCIFVIFNYLIIVMLINYIKLIVFDVI